MSGIYCIKNIINDKVYIGSAVNIGARVRHHKWALRSNNHSNIKLQRFVSKYGIDVIYIEILEKCLRNELLLKEQFYLDELNPWYNIRRDATTNSCKTCLEETKKLISIANSGTNNGNAKLNKMQVIEIRNSNETCKKLGELYSISPSQAWAVKNYKSYKNIK